MRKAQPQRPNVCVTLTAVTRQGMTLTDVTRRGMTLTGVTCQSMTSTPQLGTTEQRDPYGFLCLAAIVLPLPHVGWPCGRPRILTYRWLGRSMRFVDLDSHWLAERALMATQSPP